MDLYKDTMAIDNSNTVNLNEIMQRRLYVHIRRDTIKAVVKVMELD